MNHIIPEDKLKTTTLGDLTQSQIYSTSSATFIPQRSALEDLILIHKAKKALATFGGGGVIPSKGEIVSTTITDIPIAVASTLQPGANEVWRMAFEMLTVTNTSGSTNTITVQLEDAAGNATYNLSGQVAGSTSAQPFLGVVARDWWITEGLFIRITGNQSEVCPVTLPVQYEAM